MKNFFTNSNFNSKHLCCFLSIFLLLSFSTSSFALDIYPSHQSVSNANPSTGDQITLNVRQYAANANVNYLSPYPSIGYYLSDNTTLSTNDLYLGYDYSSIGSNDSYDPENITVTVDANWGSGTKYILFKADKNSDHAEVNEGNNVVYVQINIQQNLPDFYCFGENVSNAYLVNGAEVTLTANHAVANPGTSIYNPYPDLGFYVSNDIYLSYNDYYLGQQSSSIGSNDYSDLESLTTTVNSNWGVGVKYILFCADKNDEYSESIENNNCRSIQIEITESCVTPGSGILVYSFEYDFENWEQSTDDDIDWTRNSGGTSSYNTGPSQAHDGSYYLYVEATNNFNKEAIITSPCIDLSNTTEPYFDFWRHMEGGNMGTLVVDFYGNGQWFNDVLTYSNLTSDWDGHFANIYSHEPGMQGCSDCRIRFRATTGPGYQSDIAIDKIRIHDFTGKTDETSTIEQLDSEKANFSVFPNPANDLISLTFEGMKKIESIAITDITGKSHPLNSNVNIDEQLWLDVSNYTSGLYFITIIHDNGQLLSKKLQIQ